MTAMKTFRQLLCLAAVMAPAIPARAQDSIPPEGVRLALTYTPGTRPAVLILPVEGAEGDSVRAILQRDLDFDDRVTLISLDGEAARALVPRAGEALDFDRLAPFGATAIIEARLTPAGLSVRIH